MISTVNTDHEDMIVSTDEAYFASLVSIFGIIPLYNRPFIHLTIRPQNFDTLNTHYFLINVNVIFCWIFLSGSRQVNDFI